MIHLYNTQIDQLYIHKVGNKCRKEELFLSKDPYQISDEIRPILREFFFKPFREKEEKYFKFSDENPFSHLIVPYNTSLSEDIAEHLYNQGNHPHIKAGEVYICELSNIEIDNELFNGIGVFKSELKYDFIEFNKTESRLDLILKQGVNLDKLDKGAIIVKENNKTGFKILYIDSNKYDSKYWAENFLNLEELEDDHYNTRNYLKFCEGFGKDVVKPGYDKHEEVKFINDVYAHFAERDEFIEAEFVDQVLEESLQPDFEKYKNEVGFNFNVYGLQDFAISNETVTDCRKKLKGEINLDTGLSIKIDKGTQAAAKYLEKGWDEEKQMYYYLAYFNKETK